MLLSIESEKTKIISDFKPKIERKVVEKLTKLTPLMVACMNRYSGFLSFWKYSNFKTVKALIETVRTQNWSKGRINQFINMQLIDRMGGNNPLLFACEMGDYMICKYLLEQGADPNVTNCQGHTCNHI